MPIDVNTSLVRFNKIANFIKAIRQIDILVWIVLNSFHGQDVCL